MARAFQPSFYLWAAGLPDSEHVRMLHARAREVYADLGGVDVEDAIADYKAVVARWRAGTEGVGLREGLRCLGAIDRGNVRRDTLRERAWMQARAEVFQRTGRRIALPTCPEGEDREAQAVQTMAHRQMASRRKVLGVLADEVMRAGPAVTLEMLQSISRRSAKDGPTDPELAEAIADAQREVDQNLKAEIKLKPIVPIAVEGSGSFSGSSMPEKVPDPVAGRGSGTFSAQTAAQKMSQTPPSGKQVKGGIRRLVEAHIDRKVVEALREEAKSGRLSRDEFFSRVEELLRAA